MRFTKDSPSQPPSDDLSGVPSTTPTFNNGDVIYLDLGGIGDTELYKYNKWIYNTGKSGYLTVVYYLANGTATSVTSLSNRFIYKIGEHLNLYSPYNDIEIDTDTTLSIPEINIGYIEAGSIDVITIQSITDIAVSNCEKLSSIDNLNKGSVESLDLSNCGLTKIPDLSELSDLNNLDISYNNIAGILNLSSFNTNLTYLNVSGNKFTNVEGVPGENLSTISLSGNSLQSLNINCAHIRSLNVSMNPLVSVYLNSITDGCVINIASCTLNSIYIDNIYMNNCSVIKEYFAQKLPNTKINLCNNYLDIKEQGLNTENILVSPQFIGNRLFYDPSASTTIEDISSIDSSICIINNDTKDPKLSVIDASLSHNIIFDKIDSYYNDYDDEYIRQTISKCPYNNGILNIFNAQSLLDNPNTALARALKIGGKYFRLKEIRTNTPAISRYFPNTRIVFTPSPLQEPSTFSIFSINLVTDDM